MTEEEASNSKNNNDLVKMNIKFQLLEQYLKDYEEAVIDEKKSDLFEDDEEFEGVKKFSMQAKKNRNFRIFLFLGFCKLKGEF